MQYRIIQYVLFCTESFVSITRWFFTSENHFIQKTIASAGKVTISLVDSVQSLFGNTFQEKLISYQGVLRGHRSPPFKFQIPLTFRGPPLEKYLQIPLKFWSSLNFIFSVPTFLLAPLMTSYSMKQEVGNITKYIIVYSTTKQAR